MADRPGLGADLIDATLHRERLSSGRGKPTWPARPDDLPDGSFVTLADSADAYLVLGGRLLHWTPAGYDQALPPPMPADIQVLTPRSVVRMLAAGYPVGIHPSAYEL